MLRHPGESELIRESDDARDGGDRDKAEKPHSQPKSTARLEERRAGLQGRHATFRRI
jgi:hypothetical protein